MTQQLPTYFKEYLDERFGKVLDEIADVKQDVADLKKKVGTSSGKINKLWVAIIIIVIVLLFHFGEDSSSILKIFKFL